MTYSADRDLKSGLARAGRPWLVGGGAGVIALALLAANGVAGPRTPKPATTAQVEALAQCLTIADDPARLACYDRNARSLVEAEKKGDVVIVDEARAKEVERHAFGFNLNFGPVFDFHGKHDPVNQVTSAVAVASQGVDGKWIIKTTDGQLWRQIDDESLVEPPKPGTKVTISRGSLGSYFLKVGNESSMRAHRDE